MRLQRLFPLLALATALCAASPGPPFPVRSATDLEGNTHPEVLRTGAANMVVVMTRRESAVLARQWFEASASRVPEAVHRVSLISLRLPFFVSAGLARDKARDQVPRQFWSSSFLDRNGGMAKLLNLEESPLPYVFAVDGQGRILASAHGAPTQAGAEALWRALRGE